MLFIRLQNNRKLALENACILLHQRSPKRGIAGIMQKAPSRNQDEMDLCKIMTATVVAGLFDG